MKKSFIIIGLGRFGASITKTLIEANVDVLAVDINEEESLQQNSNIQYTNGRRRKQRRPIGQSLGSYPPSPTKPGPL